MTWQALRLASHATGESDDAHELHRLPQADHRPEAAGTFLTMITLSEENHPAMIRRTLSGCSSAPRAGRREQIFRGAAQGGVDRRRPGCAWLHQMWCSRAIDARYPRA